MALQLKAMDFEQGEAALKPEPSSRGGALPGQLKAGLESMSGKDMSDVAVHRNSSKPQAVGALAYAQGRDIHLGPGQDKHLPHEAWHVVQQKQGRVSANLRRSTSGTSWRKNRSETSSTSTMRTSRRTWRRNRPNSW